jgi:iron uptake system component EfeO
VKPDYPAQYTEIEKYLEPLIAGSKKISLDKEAIVKLADGLIHALNELQSAVENHKTAKQADDPALKAAIDHYQKYIVQQGESLVESTTMFVKAVKDGDVDKAKQLYGVARVYYERIEPIAESLGDLDPQIDARENDVDKDNWTGFHEIEKALWVNNSVNDQGKYADQLLIDVKTLHEKLQTIELKPAEVIAGAGELLNEAGTSKITGEEERYSRLDLVDLYANIEGSKAAYEFIKPELQKKDAELVTKIDERFVNLLGSLEDFRQGDSFITYDKLKQEDTKRISQAIDSTAEPLSNAAKILE